MNTLFKPYLVTCACLLAVISQLAFAQAAAPTLPAADEAAQILPSVFSGWKKGPATPSAANIAKIDPTNAALFKEAGLTEVESATYFRTDRKLVIKAYRFADTTGAVSAFTLVRTPEMALEKFCDQSASNGVRILISCSNLLLDVEFDKVTAMSPSELRTLVPMLPKASGSTAMAPNLPLYLPREVNKGAQFVIGPVGLKRTSSPLTAEIVDFDRGAEVVVSRFSSLDGSAVITLVKYPTFNMAVERQKAFDEFKKILPATPSTPGDNTPSTFYTRRAGPIVAVVSGQIAEGEARVLAEQISYEAEITQNEPGYTQKDNIANLVVNIIYLAFIIIAFTFVTGLAFGGFRILSRKYFPERFDRPQDAEFIRLDLKDDSK
ncbi:MAG TPA: DUF6599 family protein [Terriglobales bacterium]|nr:DUF6599 family protein [Terriglobales bacterium]